MARYQASVRVRHRGCRPRGAPRAAIRPSGASGGSRFRAEAGSDRGVPISPMDRMPGIRGPGWGMTPFARGASPPRGRRSRAYGMGPHRYARKTGVSKWNARHRKRSLARPSMAGDVPLSDKPALSRERYVRHDHSRFQCRLPDSRSNSRGWLSGFLETSSVSTDVPVSRASRAAVAGQARSLRQGS